jgi:hypothetical protein
MFGRTVERITKISYGIDVNMANNYGRGGKPVGYGVGNEEYSGSIEISQEEINALLLAGKKAMGRPINLSELPLTTAVIIIEDGDSSRVDEVTFKFKSHKNEFNQNDTQANVTLD